MYLFKFRILSITLLSAWLIKDAYCVMLQRYNWIKLSEREVLLKERQERKIANNYNQYREQLSCELSENKTDNYQYNYNQIVTEETILDNSIQVQEKGKVKVRKMEVKENE